jgi:hypothetical protein
MFLFFSNYILNVSFVVSHHINTDTLLGIVFLFLGFMVMACYLRCGFSNPGRLRKDTQANYLQMLVKNKPIDICYDCKVHLSITLRSSSLKDPDIARFVKHVLVCMIIIVLGLVIVSVHITTVIFLLF